MSADAAQDVRTYVLADASVAAITSRFYVNVVPHAGSHPFIWLRRAGANGADVIGESDDVWQRRFDMECVAGDLDEASNLADAVRSRLEGTSGTMGSNAYAWVSVQDQFDDYEVVNRSADGHIEVVALNVEMTLP